MNKMLSLESMTVGQIQLLIEKENRRKAQCVAAGKRWVEKNKANGTFAAKRSTYNKRFRSKKDMDDFPEKSEIVEE